MNDNVFKLLPAATVDDTNEAKILEAAKDIIHSKLSEKELAPHGRDENGNPKTPYGLKKNGLPKIQPGRDWDKEKNRDKPKDERELLKELEPDLTEYKPEPAPSQDETATEQKHDPAQASATETKQEQAPPLQPSASAEPKKEQAPPAPAPIGKNKVYISGAMFLFALDLIVPKTIEFVYGSFLGLEFSNPEDIRMSDEDKKDLAPLCNSVVDELLASLTPLQQFMLYTTIIYGSKVTYAVTQPKSKKAKKKNA